MLRRPDRNEPARPRWMIGEARIESGLGVHNPSVMCAHHDAQLTAHIVGREQDILRAAARGLGQRP
jgi:hypothetical protein